MSRTIELLCPGLLGPVPRATDAAQVAAARALLIADLDLPALSELATRADRVQGIAAAGVEAALFECMGWPASAAVPAGPVCYAHDIGEVPQRWVVRVDPVSLQADTTDLHLAEPCVRDLALDDARELVRALNEHFAGDPGQVVLGSAQRWYLLMSKPLDVRQCSPSEALGVPLTQCRATGAGARALDAFVNEVQMLFNRHPVNLRREQAGQPAVNSVWCWGGGAAARAPTCDIVTVAGGGAVGEALAMAGRASYSSLPADARSWLAQAPASGRCLAVFDALDVAARRADIERWRSALVDFDAHWLSPLLAALRAGQIERLLVHGGWPVSLRMTRSSRWRVWRRKLAWPPAELG